MWLLPVVVNARILTGEHSYQNQSRRGNIGGYTVFGSILGFCLISPPILGHRHQLARSHGSEQGGYRRLNTHSRKIDQIESSVRVYQDDSQFHEPLYNIVTKVKYSSIRRAYCSAFSSPYQSMCMSVFMSVCLSVLPVNQHLVLERAVHLRKWIIFLPHKQQ